MPLNARFIPDTAHNAMFNMAADLYLMEKCIRTQTLFLRLYAWNPPAITIGCMQSATEQLDLSLLQQNGIDWIRRPTGGRAVLHDDDITYSCIFPRTMTHMGGSIEQTYQIITKCLVAGLQTAGIVPEINDTTDPLIKNRHHIKLPCFLAPNRNEVMVSGKKLVGSAQYRSQYAVLQHGSMPMSPRFAELPHYLHIEDTEKKAQAALLRKKAVSIADIDAAIRADHLITSLFAGFRRTIESNWTVAAFTRHETATIKKITKSELFIRRRQSDPPLPIVP